MLRNSKVASAISYLLDYLFKLVSSIRANSI